MAKTKVRVIQKFSREVPIYAQRYLGGRWVKTDQVIRTDTVERESVLFSGSDQAFEAWKGGHLLPAGTITTRKAKLE